MDLAQEITYGVSSPPSFNPDEKRGVLIAVDESQESLNAFKWAVEDYYRQGDVFHLLHIVKCLQARTEVYHGELRTPCLAVKLMLCCVTKESVASCTCRSASCYAPVSHS